MIAAVLRHPPQNRKPGRDCDITNPATITPIQLPLFLFTGPAFLRKNRINSPRRCGRCRHVSGILPGAINLLLKGGCL